MNAATRSLSLVRRGWVQLWGLLLALAMWPVVALDLLPAPAFRRGDLAAMGVVALLTVAMGRLVVREVGLRPRVPIRRFARFVHELEVGILPLTAVYVLFMATGGVESALYPLVYLLVSVLMVLHRDRWAATGWIVAVIVLELALWRSSTPAMPWRLVAVHLSFVVMFAAANVLVLSGLVARLRRAQDRDVREEIERMRQEARDFRLIATQLPLQSRARRREDEELRMAQGAVESIHTHLFHTLELLRTSLDLQTCVLLWTTDRESSASSRGEPAMVIKEVATICDAVRERAALAGLGPLSGVARTGKPLRLKSLAGSRPLPYYEGGGNVTDLCVVPLVEGINLRGLLCADRTNDRVFTPDEETRLNQAAAHLLRIVEHERVFAAIERGKYEQEQFYRASELLNQALTVEDVYHTTFAAVRAIAAYDLAVVSSYDAQFGTHRVLAVDARSHDDENRRSWAEVADKLRELEFADGSGLVAMAVKNRHYMPASAELTDADTVVFTARTRLRRARSVLVLPLIRGEQVMGAITLAASKTGAFATQTRDMLGVISNQVTVSLQNARLYQSMEQRATTDGLTGLTNHRSFQERLEQLHALSERTGHSYSVILTDIDHFKSINDTYGHPVGDQVLKRVSAMLVGRVRKVDIVARYGGEEFVLVLPDTDGTGAAHFANRLREDIAAMTVASEHGSFSVTISMGVAQFPRDGKDRQSLIERADQALYQAKAGGRNRVEQWSDGG